MTPRYYDILTRAIEEGAGFGVSRAFKHTDTPSHEVICNAVVDEVTNAICEVFDFAGSE